MLADVLSYVYAKFSLYYYTQWVAVDNQEVISFAGGCSLPGSLCCLGSVLLRSVNTVGSEFNTVFL